MVPTQATSATQVQLDAFAAMSPSDRVARAMAMAGEVKELTLTGIRMRHPEFTPAQVRREWMRILHGDELVQEVFGPESNEAATST